MKSQPERLLTTAEAAHYLRVSQASVRRWSDAGLLKARRVGRRRELRFTESDLILFLNQGSTTARARPTDDAVNVGGAQLTVPGHIATFYGNDGGRLRLTVPFFAEGLRAGQPCFLAASGMVLDTYLDALRKRPDLDLDKAENQGRFTVVEFKEGSALNAVEQWENHFAQSLTTGPTLIRIAGEMAAVRSMLRSETEMLALEEALEVAVRRYPVTAICQYDVREFSGTALLRALKAHPDLYGMRIGAFLN